MTTVPGVSTSSTYGYSTSATGTDASSSAAQSGSSSPQLSDSTLAELQSVLVSLGNGSSSSLTYDASGLLSALQKLGISSGATSADSASSTDTAELTPQQKAQQALLQAQQAVNDTLNAILSSGSQDDSGSSDLASLFSSGTSGSSAQTSLFDMLSGNSGSNASSGAQETAAALFAAQNVTNSTLLNSLSAKLTSSSKDTDA